MPINVKVEGDPASIRSTANWLRSELSTGVNACTDQMLGAGSGSGRWEGSAGDRFRDAICASGLEAADLATEADRLGASFEQYADDLQTALAGMERAKEIARAGGLTVTDTEIADPGPAPAAPEPVARGASTLVAIEAHDTAAAACAEHAAKVEAYQQAAEEASRARNIVDRAQEAGEALWATIQTKPFQRIAQLGNRFVKASLLYNASALTERAGVLAAQARLAGQVVDDAAARGVPSAGAALAARNLTASAAAAEGQALWRTRLATKLPIIGNGLTAVGAAWEIHQGKPVGRTIVTALASTAAMSLVGATLATTAPVWATVGALTAAGILGSMAAGWAYDKLPEGVREKIDEGIEFGWEHHPQVIIGKAAIEVTQDVGEKAIGLGKDTLDAGEDLYNRAKDLLPFG